MFIWAIFTAWLRNPEGSTIIKAPQRDLCSLHEKEQVFLQQSTINKLLKYYLYTHITSICGSLAYGWPVVIQIYSKRINVI